MADCGWWMDSRAKGWARAWRMGGEQAFCITAKQFSRRIIAAIRDRYEKNAAHISPSAASAPPRLGVKLRPPLDRPFRQAQGPEPVEGLADGLAEGLWALGKQSASKQL